MPHDFNIEDVELMLALQKDATLTVKELAAHVGLSTNACWRRVQALEKSGAIVRRVAILDPSTLGVGTTVFVSVRSPEHSTEWLASFAEAVSSQPEVVEFYRMAGDVDYIIKLRVGDIAHYDRIYQELIRKVRLVDVSAAFAMEEIKCTSEIPVLLPGWQVKPEQASKLP